jgi:hypothetical protein
VRQPDVLGYIRTKGMEMLSRFLAEGDFTLPPGWSPTEQWLAKHYPGMMATRALISLLPQMVLHNALTERFETLDWWVLEFKPEAPTLLLSDLPIHWEGGITTEKFFIHMPIAPDRAFFGTASAETKSHLLRLPSIELIRRINRASLASSSKRIWGIDAKQGRAFIEENLDIVGVNVEPFQIIAEKFWARRNEK